MILVWSAGDANLSTDVSVCACWKEDPPQQLTPKSKPQETREAHGGIFPHRKQFQFFVILLHHPTSALNQYSHIGKCFVIIMDSCIFHFKMAQSIMTLCKIHFEEMQKKKKKIHFQNVHPDARKCHWSNSSVVSYKSLHIFKKIFIKCFIKWPFKLVYQNYF